MGEIKKITFEIDDRGRFRVKNAAEALLFLDEAHKNPRLEMILGPDPLPNNSVKCDLLPPPGNKAGCPNEDCPYAISVRLTPLIQEERIRIVDEKYRE